MSTFSINSESIPRWFEHYKVNPIVRSNQNFGITNTKAVIGDEYLNFSLKMLGKFLKILISLILFFSVLIAVFYKCFPILLKWADGTARIIGKPIDAIVYTNGQINNGIKVYRVDKYWDGEKANDYLLSLTEFDTEGKLKFINIDLKEKWIGRPVCTNADCYKSINGYLFQSETGGHFDPFDDDIKGYNFNPQLSFTGQQIRFNTPPNQLRFDSIRIELGACE